MASLVDVITQDARTGRPVVFNIVAATIVSSFGFGMSVLQLYDISVSNFGVAPLTNPTPVSLLILAVTLFVFTFFFLLAIVGIWQLRSFSSRAGLFVEADGALKRGSETELSLRVATFRSIIESLSVETSREALNHRFFDVGKQAGRSFAGRIEQIHDALERTGLAWKDMGDGRRLTWWAEYDRSSGLGLISTVARANQILVEIKHEELFGSADGRTRAGEAIAYLLAGYCETVINGILGRARVSFVADSLEVEPRHASYAFTVHRQ
jgi:hypothetical protein